MLESARRRHDSVADRHCPPELRARRGQLHHSDLLLVTLGARRGRRRLDLRYGIKISLSKSRYCMNDTRGQFKDHFEIVF